MVRTWFSTVAFGPPRAASRGPLHAVRGRQGRAEREHRGGDAPYHRDRRPRASVGIYFERGVQEASRRSLVPTLLGVAYVSLHFAGTTAALVWLHRRHPEHFPIVRTTLVVATALALVGYGSTRPRHPASPVSASRTPSARSTGINLSSDLLGALYNPFAAVPSLHFGYALIVGVALATRTRRGGRRVAGAAVSARDAARDRRHGEPLRGRCGSRRARRRRRVAWLVGAGLLVEEPVPSTRTAQGNAREPCVS